MVGLTFEFIRLFKEEVLSLFEKNIIQSTKLDENSFAGAV
jgi:hypothetical protein